jgi:hypothetical protein
MATEGSQYWHVIITPAFTGKRRRADDSVAVDNDRNWIERRILEPRRQGQAIALAGKTFEWDQVEQIRISVSDVPSSVLIEQLKAADRESSVAVLGGPGYQWRAAYVARDVTEELIEGPPGTSRESGAAPARVDPRRVMVVYGRDSGARRAMFDFLRALGLEPAEWPKLVAETEKAAPYIGEILEQAFERAAAVVVLFTPDDEAKLRDDLVADGDPGYERELTPQARPNVIFEAGMAFGIHPDRTVLVESGQLRPFSDVFGRHAVRLDGSAGPLRDIANRLKTAGCQVDDTGEDWADPTRFTFPERSGKRQQEAGNGDSSGPGGTDEAESLRVLFRGPADAAVRSLEALVTNVANAVREQEGFGRQAAHLLEKLNNDLASAHSVTLKCTEAGAPLSELQESFITCFRAYQDLIHPVRDVGHEAGYAWTSDGNYSLWKRNDEDFLGRLEELTLSSTFSDLRARVTVHLWPERGRREYWA